MKYLGTLQKVPFGGHGYAGMMTQSILHDQRTEDMDLAQAKNVALYAINELKTRFLVSQTNYVAKVVDKDGIREIDLTQ